MKHMLDDFFKELAPNEFDEIMPDNLDVKLPKTVLKRIEKKALQKSGIKNNRQHFNFKILAPIAACLVFVVGIGGFAMVAEAKEYNAAVDFFAQNGLSSNGLSREDLKAVYRDISTNHFTNNKTAEVIRRSVPGVEIFQQEPTPEELSALWNRNVQNSAGACKGIDYYAWTKYKFDETLGFDVFDKSVVDCYNNGETIWSTEISSFLVLDCALTSNGTAAWGYTWTWSSEQPSPAWLAMLDNSGNKLWERQLDHNYKNENIVTVLDNDDGTWAVITRGDNESLCLAQYDINGNELSFEETMIGVRGIRNAARLGDGYLVQLYNYTSGDTAHLVKLDRDGSFTDTFVYESEDCDYYITDMTEFEGNVYLSAYAVPKQIDEGGRHDIANVLDYVFTKENWEISSEELTPIVRENYTAVLLLCNPNGGEPKNFYSVKGSLGGTLAIEEDQLKWDVESVVSTYFSPATSSFSVGGECRVYRYSFDKSGALAEREDTGETTVFAR